MLNQNHHRFSLGYLGRIFGGMAIVSIAGWGHSLPCVASSPDPVRLDNINSADVKVKAIDRNFQISNLLVQNPPQPEAQPSPTNNSIDINPEIINGSPVLQKWLKGIPNVMDDIKNDPSFRTRVKVGYSQYPSAGQSGGFHVAIDDIFLGQNGLSASLNYNAASNANRTAYGADAQYYLLPLGGYFNITPLVGFRHLQTDKYNRDGLNLGVKLMLVPSRGGGADIALSQSWVGLGGSTETGLTTISVGYAITNNLRLSTDIQQQNAKENYDSRIGFGVEWMP